MLEKYTQTEELLLMISTTDRNQQIMKNKLHSDDAIAKIVKANMTQRMMIKWSQNEINLVEDRRS